jgi:hypothetical protein
VGQAPTTSQDTPDSSLPRCSSRAKWLRGMPAVCLQTSAKTTVLTPDDDDPDRFSGGVLERSAATSETSAASLALSPDKSVENSSRNPAGT